MYPIPTWLRRQTAVNRTPPRQPQIPDWLNQYQRRRATVGAQAQRTPPPPPPAPIPSPTPQQVQNYLNRSNVAPPPSTQAPGPYGSLTGRAPFVPSYNRDITTQQPRTILPAPVTVTADQTQVNNFLRNMYHANTLRTMGILPQPGQPHNIPLLQSSLETQDQALRRRLGLPLTGPIPTSGARSTLQLNTNKYSSPRNVVPRVRIQRPGYATTPDQPAGGGSPGYGDYGWNPWYSSGGGGGSDWVVQGARADIQQYKGQPVFKQGMPRWLQALVSWRI